MIVDLIIGLSVVMLVLVVWVTWEISQWETEVNLTMEEIEAVHNDMWQGLHLSGRDD
tara:strand:- start:1127 stop:1297 length:171 start_codon:yes stop_codon:yes gene_type:complete